jgi:biotin synthase
MADKTLQAVLNRLYAADVLDKTDVECALSLNDPAQMAELFVFADEIRRRHVGDGILLRGIVEFSNHCDNTCKYCGLNKTNTNLARYKLTDRQILNCIEQIANAGIGTVVLQSGEEADLDADWLAGIIREIKTRFDTAITLSVGERQFDDYAMWKEAGADRYLLKIETTNRQLYQKLHPQMSFDNRLKCSKNLGMLGYQNGSGNIIGLPGQTISDIADDIMFFARERFDMIGIGPFIPHPATALSDSPAGEVEMVLKAIAVTRIVTKDAHLPATTAIGSLNGNDHRPAALTAGANVMMPNFTPQPWRQLYEIYPGKRCSTEAPGTCGACIDMMANGIGRTIDLSRGDSLKKKRKECA